jgi:uncharacterized protein YoxC
MATKGIGRPLTIMLRADTDGFSKGIATAEGKLKSLNKSVGKASAVAAAALTGLAAAGLDFAKLAAADEKSARQLEITLQNVTGATKAQTAAVEDYITTTSIALGIQDDKLRPAFGRLVRSTEDVTKAQKLLNLALDISSGTGKPLELVANGLGKAYDGNAASLGRLGLGLDDTILKSKDFGVIYEALAGKFQGFAKAEAATAEGSFARLSVAIDEAKESIGYGLLPFVQLAADKLAEFAPKIQQNAGDILKWAGIIAGTAVGIIALNTAITISIGVLKVYNAIVIVLRTSTLFLAAATGSARAAQVLAEATYKGSKTALILYHGAQVILTAGTKVATVAQAAFNTVLMANPIGLVIGLVAGLAYALKKLSDSTTGTTKDLNGFYVSTGKGSVYVKNAVKRTNELANSINRVSNAVMENRDVMRSKGRNGLLDTNYQPDLSWVDEIVKGLDKTSKGTNKQGKAEAALERIRERAQKLADKRNKLLTKEKEKLDKLKQSFKDLSAAVQDSIKSEFSFSKAYEEKGTGGFIAALQKQADKAKAFAGKIGQLVRLGLSQASLDQILAAGPTVGSAIADELLAGGSAAVSQVNSLVESVNSVAATIANSTAAAFFQAGITQGEAIVKGIIQAAKDAGFIIKDGTITLPSQPGKIKDIVKNDQKSSQSFSQNQAQAQGSSYNIVINGAIDPEGVRRSLERVFQQSSRRTGPVNFVGATL